jgi:hypothetical protein
MKKIILITAVVLVSLAAHAQITPDASCTGGSGGSQVYTVGCSSAMTVTAGDTIECNGSGFDFGAMSAFVTDNLNGTYDTVYQAPHPGSANAGTIMAVFQSSAGGSIIPYLVNYEPQHMGISCRAFKGTRTTFALDGGSVNQTNTATAANPTSGTVSAPTNANEVVVGLLTYPSSQTVTNAAGWLPSGTLTFFGESTNYPSYDHYQIQTTATAVNSPFTVGSAQYVDTQLAILNSANPAGYRGLAGLYGAPAIAKTNGVTVTAADLNGATTSPSSIPANGGWSLNSGSGGTYATGTPPTATFPLLVQGIPHTIGDSNTYVEIPASEHPGTNWVYTAAGSNSGQPDWTSWMMRINSSGLVSGQLCDLVEPTNGATSNGLLLQFHYDTTNNISFKYESNAGVSGSGSFLPNLQPGTWYWTQEKIAGVNDRYHQVLFSQLIGGTWQLISTNDWDVLCTPGSQGASCLTPVATATTTGTGSVGSTALTVASGTGIVVDQVVVGPGIPWLTTVTAVSGTSVTLSQNIVQALVGTPINFYTPPLQLITATNGSASSNSTALTIVAATYGTIAVGDLVGGVGVQEGTVVSGVSGTAITLSLPTTTAIPSGSGVTFWTPPNAIGFNYGKYSSCSMTNAIDVGDWVMDPYNDLGPFEPNTTPNAPTWAGFIDPSRAIVWDGHTGFSIPSYTTACSTQPSLATGIGNAAANATSIQNALASCDSTHNVVNIPSGTYYSNGITYGTQGAQVMRGAGANLSKLIMESEATCSGTGAGICMFPGNGNWYYAGNAAVVPPSGTRQCLWTAGYVQGNTSITLNSCPGHTPTVGDMMVLDQANDEADTGGVYLCDSYTTFVISSFTGTSGTLTFTFSNTTGNQALLAGATFALFGFSGGNAGLNGQSVTVLSAGLSSTTFEATVTGSGYSSGTGTAGSAGCTINDGASTNASGRQITTNGITYTYSQKQVTIVTSVSGSGTGPFTVGITSPGVYFTNIRASQNPGAWFPGQVQNEGLENIAIDASAIPDTATQMTACYQCWIKGVTSINAGRAHTLDNLGFQNTVRDSYLYGSQGRGPNFYGMEMEQTSDSLIENNICQQQTVCIMEGNTTGSVVGYNRDVGSVFSNPNYLNAQYASHNAGNDFNLWEANDFQNTNTDEIWGSSYGKTFFRGLHAGWQPQASGPIYSTIPFISRPFSRAHNVIGNVFGMPAFGSTPAYHNTYESYATTSSAGVNASSVATSIYSFGWTGVAETTTGGCTAPPICDSLVRSTMVRWGNYDTVNAATQWSPTEAAAPSVPYINQNFNAPYFSSLPHTLPASLYYLSAPSWWPVGKNWPATGPDVTTGNVGICNGGTYSGAQATSSSQCTGGTLVTAWASHVTSLPAQDCYLNTMGGPPDGSGGVLSFNASTCYGTVVNTAPCITCILSLLDWTEMLR